MELYNKYLKLNFKVLLAFLFAGFIHAQSIYNHPELNWHTLETEHFLVHYHDETEMSAREGATVAESVYAAVTDLYEFEPKQKTHLVFIDTDDYSNGAAYFYDNKIFIWASPLNFHLRGNHRWLQNVITHEFVHIVSLQKSMKFGSVIPGLFLQYMGYEEEKRKDVLYGYPNNLISYTIPGTNMPPWMAEGIAQFMYKDATFDSWDSHRDMILRDHTIYGTLFSMAEMNTFGKKGIGNESTYNAGYALALFIASKYGQEKLMELSKELSRLTSFSINSVIKRVLGVSADELHEDFTNALKKRYNVLTEGMENTALEGRIVAEKGTTNIYPKWSPDGNSIAYLSNKKNDYFGQTDLFIMNLNTGEDEKVASNVTSAPSWSQNGKKLVYSGLPKSPDKNGSKYLDIYIFDLEKEKSKKITNGLRAYSPVWLADTNMIAYLSTYDGTQNISILDLNNEERAQVTDYKNREIISNLSFDPSLNRLEYDLTTNHFADLYFVDLNDSSSGMLFSNPYWDERDGISLNGFQIYAEDRTGIFNLYAIDEKSGKQGYVTNVYGGAFMPDISAEGKIVFSIYKNGGYKLSILDSIEFLNSEDVGYSEQYFKKNLYLGPAIAHGDTTPASKYKDQVAPLFIMPRLMLDYGTLKPGLYFYSSEILERISIAGSASINSYRDIDAFLQFELRRFYPTLYMDVFYATRNIKESSFYRVYKIDDELKFRFIGLNTGFRIPIKGQVIDLYASTEVARAFVSQSIPQKNLMGGIAYDYYRGVIVGGKYDINGMKPGWNQNINPSQGYTIHSQINYEWNNFITGLDLSDAGTIVEKWEANNGLRVNLNSHLHLTIPKTENLTASFNMINGYFSNASVDSFFHFYGGGLPGLKGYPFYSIQGTKMVIGTGTMRLPIMMGKHIPLGWFTMQNSTLGLVFQTGDAWIEKPEFKVSAGFEFRLNGFSFYNYPTALGFEVHKGITKFDVSSGDETWEVGNDLRYYFTLLFGF